MGMVKIRPPQNPNSSIDYAILYLHTKFEPNQSILGEVMTIFPKSKMAAAAILFLRKWWLWPRLLLQGVTVILHQHTEFDDNPPIHGLEIARWWNPKWRPPPSWILVRWHFWSGIPIYGGILYLLTKFEPNPSILRTNRWTVGRTKRRVSSSVRPSVRPFVRLLDGVWLFDTICGLPRTGLREAFRSVRTSVSRILARRLRCYF